ncbi:hypothetical protein [Streptomyces sp. NPDC058457]|uniref:hypothetical protein n=1 Tax=Streptomyces sp. NPDC058457 TaxID=3346507 RepID=UPI003659F2BB
MIARIVQMVEGAIESKAPTQLIIEKVEQRYSIAETVDIAHRTAELRSARAEFADSQVLPPSGTEHGQAMRARW